MPRPKRKRESAPQPQLHLVEEDAGDMESPVDSPAIILARECAEADRVSALPVDPQPWWRSQDR